MPYDKELVLKKLYKWEGFLKNYTLPTWSELPALELYMDQVIALLSEYLNFIPGDKAGDKMVTPSIINNYVRMKIMPPPVKKKYLRVHLAYLIIICTLKQSLNIALIQKIIPMGLSEDEVHASYDGFVSMHRSISCYFIDQVRSAAVPVMDIDNSSADSVDKLVTACAVASSLCRLLTQKLIGLQGLDFEDDPN